MGVLQYEYDLNGNELSNTRYNSDGTTEYRYVTEFNTDGKKVSRTNYDGNGIIKSVSLFDSNGNVINETNYNLEGVLTTQLITTYDALGHRLSETIYNSDGEIMSKRIYEYEHDQLTHLQIYYRSSDGSLLLGVDTQYDSYGNVLRQRNPVWAYYTSYNYLSDTSGKIISKKGYIDGALTEETIYTYNASGNIFSEATYTADGTLRERTEYDFWGNVTSYYYSLNGKTLREEASYDTYGNLLKRHSWGLGHLHTGGFGRDFYGIENMEQIEEIDYTYNQRSNEILSRFETIQTITHNEKGEDIIEETGMRINYDLYGNITKEEFYENGVLIGYHTYEYIQLP